MKRRPDLAGTVSAVSWALVLTIVAPAFGQGRYVRDDQVPWGPDGTIGRGTDGNLPPSRGGFTLFSGNLGLGGRERDRTFFPGDTSRHGHAPAPAPTIPQARPAPYLTGRFHEPGDGFRYPLYYDPATRTFFYYPVAR